MYNFRRHKLENRWKKEDKDPTVPAFSGEPGITIGFPDNCNELDIFKCFITDQLIGYITINTPLSILLQTQKQGLMPRPEAGKM